MWKLCKKVTIVNITCENYVKTLPWGPNTCILGWTFNITLNVGTRKLCWIFKKKREILIVHLTNYINLNHSNYNWNLITILSNLIHGLIELWPLLSKELLPMFTLIEVTIALVQGVHSNFDHLYWMNNCASLSNDHPCPRRDQPYLGNMLGIALVHGVWLRLS
jgi:hypothetical protein